MTTLLSALMGFIVLLDSLNGTSSPPVRSSRRTSSAGLAFCSTNSLATLARVRHLVKASRDPRGEWTGCWRLLGYCWVTVCRHHFQYRRGSQIYHRALQCGASLTYRRTVLFQLHIIYTSSHRRPTRIPSGLTSPPPLGILTGSIKMGLRLGLAILLYVTQQFMQLIA